MTVHSVSMGKTHVTFDYFSKDLWLLQMGGTRYIKCYRRCFSMLEFALTVFCWWRYIRILVYQSQTRHLISRSYSGQDTPPLKLQVLWFAAGCILGKTRPRWSAVIGCWSLVSSERSSLPSRQTAPEFPRALCPRWNQSVKLTRVTSYGFPISWWRWRTPIGHRQGNKVHISSESYFLLW